jgi:hypothetical protein
MNIYNLSIAEDYFYVYLLFRRKKATIAGGFNHNSDLYTKLLKI